MLEVASAASRSPAFSALTCSRTAFTRLLIAIAATLFHAHAEIEGGRRVGEGADRDVVDAGRADLRDVLERDSAGSLELDGVAGSSHRRHRLLQLRRGHIVEQEPAGPGLDGLSDLAQVAAFDLDRHLGPRLPGAPNGLPQPSDEHRVVLLDQDRIVEANAVVGPAAGGDGGLLEGAQAGDRLASVEDSDPGPLRSAHKTGGEGSDPREVAEEVQGRPFTRDQSLDAPTDPGDGGGNLVAPPPLRRQRLELVGASLAKDLGHHLQPENDARLLLGDRRRAYDAPGYDRFGGAVARAQVLGQGPGDEIARLSVHAHRRAASHENAGMRRFIGRCPMRRPSLPFRTCSTSMARTCSVSWWLPSAPTTPRMRSRRPSSPPSAPTHAWRTTA